MFYSVITNRIPRRFLGGNLGFRAHSHLATATQIFDDVSMPSEMGGIVTNVTVGT